LLMKAGCRKNAMCFVTVFLLSGPRICGCLGKFPGERRFFSKLTGKNVAVRRMFLRQSAPLSVLCKKAEAYPAGTPIKTKSSSIAVMSPPRLAGERKPSTAKHMVITAMLIVCGTQEERSIYIESYIYIYIYIYIYRERERERENKGKRCRQT